LPSSYRARSFITVVTETCLCYIGWASLIKSIFSNHIYLKYILILVFHLRFGLPNGVCTFSQNLRRDQSCVMNRIKFMLLTFLQLHLTPSPPLHPPPTHTQYYLRYVYVCTHRVTHCFEVSRIFLLRLRTPCYTQLAIRLRFCLLKYSGFSSFRANKMWVKVKASRYRPGVTQRVGRGIALLFHDRGTRRGWVVSSTHRPHFTPGKHPVPILQEAGWAPGPVWTGGKSRPHRDSISDRPACSRSLYRLS